MRLLIGAIICLLVTLQTAVSQDCVETCPAGEEWNSNVTVVEQGQTFLTLEWEVDQPSTVYLVQWFQERVLIGDNNTTDLMYTISNLMSNTQYMVTICRQMVAVDNCGNCNLCATTLQGPPDPPGGVAIQVNGPDSILVIWQQLGGGEMVDMWHILCVVSDTGEIVHNSTRIALQIAMFKNQDVFQLTPETTYNCSVAASNAFGLGEYSPVAQGITLARTTVPGLVSDVRVFVYHPLSEETSLTGLMLWTPPAGSTIDGYSVTLNVGGSPVPLVYQPPGNLSSHVLAIRDSNTLAVSFLQEGTTYDVQITVFNHPSGSGNSSFPISFTLNGPDYPRQVLLLDSGMAQVVGMNTNFVTPPFATELTHILADTIAREAYYYSSGLDTIFKSSLQSGERDILKFIGSSVKMLSLVYDWVARAVYYAVKTTNNQLELYSIPVLDKDSNAQLFPSLDHTLPSNTTFQLTMDPTSGFLYWIQSDRTSVQLFSLDLRQSNSTRPTNLSTTPHRRKRQSADLSSLNLTPILTLDPITRDLLVATSSGNIHSCNTTSRQCMRLVDAVTLAGANDPSTIGLPPTTLAADDRHLYWSGGSGVFGVLRTDPTSLIIVSSTGAPSILTPLSPGAQPLGRRECLSPPLTVMMSRPIPMVVDRSSTTLTLEWEEPVLSPECSDVFSFPLLSYTIVVANPQIDPFLYLNMGLTYGTQFELTGLMPFSEYFVSLIATNLFTQRRSSFDNQQGLSLRGESTLAGVPDAPTILSTNVFGTSSVELNWTRGAIRGNEDTVSYFVLSETGQGTAVMNEIIIVDSFVGIPPGSDHELQVLVSNGVFNSSATRVHVSFWRLAPRPFSDSVSNSALTARLTLEPVTHSDITSVAIQYCEVSAPSTNCSCPDGSKRTEFQDGKAPTSFEFPITGLQPHTLYCVQSVGQYREIPGRTVAGGEVTPGLGHAEEEARTLATLSLTATHNNQPLFFTDVISQPDGSGFIVIICHGPGNLMWTSSTRTLIPTNQSGTLFQMFDSIGKQVSLIFRSFSFNEVAVYTCESSLSDINNVPITESVLVTTSDPAVFIGTTVIKVLEGDSVSIEAGIYSSSPSEVQWFLGEQLLNITSNPQLSQTIEGNVYRLNIASINSQLLGLYTVVVTREGQTASDNVTVFYAFSPTVTLSETELTVTEGEEVRVQCLGEGVGVVRIRWYFDNEESALQSGNNLVIPSVASTHTGLYECRVSNIADTVTKTVQITVRYMPFSMIQYNSISSMFSPIISPIFGESTTAPVFMCTSDGYPQPTITWRATSETGFPNGVITQAEGQELVWTRPFEYTDSMQYECVSENELGTSVTTMNLFIPYSAVSTTPMVTTPMVTTPMVTTSQEDSTIAAIYGGAVGGILVLVCLIGICLIALLLLRKKLSSEEQIAAPIQEEVGLSGNDIQLESNDAYGKAVRCSKGIQLQSNHAGL